MAIAQSNTQLNTQQSALILQSCALTPTPAQLVRIKGPEDDDGLDALISGHAAQRPDERKEIEVVGENKFGELLRKYECFFEVKELLNRTNFLNSNVTECLTSDEINIFLQTTTKFEDDAAHCILIGEFITQLIQNSYDAGYNNFVLDTINLKENINKFGHSLKGYPKRIIYIQIDGDVGWYCGNSASYSSFIINGNADIFGNSYAKNCSFTLNGNVNLPDFEFYYEQIESCTFKTPNKKTLDKILKYVKGHFENKVYFIHPDGTEELVRR